MDRIELTGLRAVGWHGVAEHERRDGQEFVVDVTLHCDTRGPARSDDLADTVDYAAVAHAAVELISGPPVDLIETLADRIAQRTLRIAASAPVAVRSVEVTVHKPSAPIPLAFTDVSVTARRRQPVPVVLALGSNVGDRERALRQAVGDLRQIEGLNVTGVSDPVQSEPVGGVSQDRYLNAVLTADCTLSPWELLRACQRLEDRAGRVRAQRWGPRTLDIDVISFGNRASGHQRLTLPHPRAHERAFVLMPWAQLDPGAQLGGHAVRELAQRAPDRAGVQPWPQAIR